MKLQATNLRGVSATKTLDITETPVLSATTAPAKLPWRQSPTMCFPAKGFLPATARPNPALLLRWVV